MTHRSSEQKKREVYSFILISFYNSYLLGEIVLIANSLQNSSNLQ